MSACDVCSNLQPEVLKHLHTGQYATLFLNAGELASSAQQEACCHCKLLSDAISTRQRDWSASAHLWRPIRVQLADGKPMQLRYRPHDSDSLVDLQVSRDSIEHGFEIPNVIGVGPDIPESSGSPESISLIQKWYNDCTTQHELCDLAPTTMPTRILDISEQDPLLVASAKIPLCEYVALSYCWGNPNKHRTLRTMTWNYTQYQAGIAFTAFPATLRDAISLARTLGFKYIWIDALCITQDDHDDWTKEAANMCRIYSEASLTIVASRSDGSDTSIFGTQKFSQFDMVLYRGLQLKVRTNLLKVHEINPVIPYGPDGDPVTHRAWTYQEAVLSNRSVHFTSDELRWECNTWRHCQCGQMSKKFPLSYDPEYVEYESYRLWRVAEIFPATSILEAYVIWRGHMVYYTSRMLTKDSDRLVALSGLAQRFSMVMQEKFLIKDAYLAGLWRGGLPEQLLWFVELRKFSVLHGRRHDRPSEWRAPSWSWASMEAPSNYLSSLIEEQRLEIIEATTEPLNADPFGQVKSGRLKARARILHNIRFIPSSQSNSGSRFPLVKWCGLDLRVNTSYFDDDRGDETDEYLGDPNLEISLLVVGYSKKNNLHECLALIPVVGRIATYERIGLIRLGQHFREPAENAAAIADAPIETVTLF